MRIYDPRLGKFLSVDPISKNYPQLTPYQFASNRPINGIDMDGLEWVLKIYDPQVLSDFIKAVDEKDIYKQRGIIYKAINNEITYEELEQRNKNHPEYKTEANLNKETNKFKGAELIYDKNSAPGLTLKYQKVVNNATTDGVLSWEKQKGASDANYPVDVRMINSPEHKDFYGKFDFVGSYSNIFGSKGLYGGGGFIKGYMKGYGNVNYITTFIGISTPTIGVEKGMLTGNFNLSNVKDASPSTLEGFGASQGWGAGIAARANWYSFANYDDMKNFRTNKATISGEMNEVSLSISPKKLKGFSANRSYSYTALIPPNKN